MNDLSLTAKRLKKLRESHNLSQAYVAEYLGISRPSYVRYETGVNNPSRNIKKLALLFNVSADYLLGVDDQPTKSAQPFSSNNTTTTENKTALTNENISRTAYLKYLIKQQGSVKSFAAKIDMPYTTLLSILKNIGGASMDNISKICNGLGITTDDLNKYSEYNTNGENLTIKDEMQIIQAMEDILNSVDNGQTFAAYGGTIENEVDKTLFKKSLFDALLIAKKMAKAKFTPKKYRK